MLLGITGALGPLPVLSPSQHASAHTPSPGAASLGQAVWQESLAAADFGQNVRRTDTSEFGGQLSEVDGHTSDTEVMASSAMAGEQPPVLGPGAALVPGAALDGPSPAGSHGVVVPARKRSSGRLRGNVRADLSFDADGEESEGSLDAPSASASLSPSRVVRRHLEAQSPTGARALSFASSVPRAMRGSGVGRRKSTGSQLDSPAELQCHPLTLMFYDSALEREFVGHYNSFVLHKIRHTLQYGLLADMLLGLVVISADLWDEEGRGRSLLLLTRLLLVLAIAAHYAATFLPGFARRTQLITGAFYLLRGLLLLASHAVMQRYEAPAHLSDLLPDAAPPPAARSLLSFSTPATAISAFDVIYFHCVVFNFSGLRFIVGAIVSAAVQLLFALLVALTEPSSVALCMQFTTGLLFMCVISASHSELRVRGEFIMRRHIRADKGVADSIVRRAPARLPARASPRADALPPPLRRRWAACFRRTSAGSWPRG